MNEIILTNLSPETLELAVAKRDQLVDESLGNFMDAVAECGRYLIALEEVSEHGTFGDRLDRCFKKGKSLAYIYMKIARNFQRVGNLRTAPSLRQAMRLIAEYEEAAGTKRTRKPTEPAPEVIDNRPESRTIAQPKPTPDVE